MDETPAAAVLSEESTRTPTLVDSVGDTYRQLMNRQLTVQESRHRLARAIRHGGRGQIRQAWREGQKDQLAAVVLWCCGTPPTWMPPPATRRGLRHQDEDVARLSPLKDRHMNFPGRHLFNIKASGPGQGLRPFRDPDAVEDAADDN
ncbi:Tn3 family transposase [Streptomyces sp. NPDC053792]|uniref:Tn3 family transposase n=1 Tax=Streptomyces sp. NPDC053792 TaxID=3365716 RepID=UPI0037D8F198